MNIGIMYVLHGRKTSIPQKLSNIVKDFTDTLALPQAIGMLEGQQQTLEDAVKALEERPVDKIIVVPVLLFPATHAREDIPQRMKASASVPFEICETLGTTRAVYDWLKSRLQEATERHPKFPVMLVAHGTTHYPEPAEQLGRIAVALSSDLGREVFATNHLGEPHYQAISGEHPYIVQRLFFTDGYLAKKIGIWFEKNRPQDVLLEQLLDAEAVHTALKERLEDAGCIR
ncbi:sirohydrochlorin chelatase [Trichococcus pasteurii]|uniref:Cobalamin (Vitamin b12) biosynthesis cbix n=1 Tax=Trichococcus pasteurii TaxID=43064 RepID=A0A1W1IBR2_9LACT|nr:CbiX/SirB N-terminal domain-containing protein [Trichococcus pasteurii]SFE25132.1 CbiX protein [Trichococcus pasteurii]SLM50478.1 cobalamin (vitamin b12) biosynthesis cbix [Trichococcus pasteurii]SSB91359.1 cobalamin (vitamin b12) biosynthesis cbix [Trichococcus pasteurii]